MYLSNFAIGLTDVAPTERAPSSLLSSDYVLCAHYPGTVPNAQTVSIECSRNVHGRYLFVLRRVSNTHLVLCELEAYCSGRFPSTRKHHRDYAGYCSVSSWCYASLASFLSVASTRLITYIRLCNM